jgi:hypothetical protein
MGCSWEKRNVFFKVIGSAEVKGDVESARGREPRTTRG